MFVIPNQSSVPMAYTQFTAETAEDPVEGNSRMIPSSNRMRIVDCMEEFVKYTIVMKPHFALFGDRCSEREERVEKERQRAEKEAVDARKTSEDVDSMDLVNGINVVKI
jgi:arsenical resistance protein ArsH